MMMSNLLNVNKHIYAQIIAKFIDDIGKSLCISLLQGLSDTVVLLLMYSAT